jgi:hypothetical protein
MFPFYPFSDRMPIFRQNITVKEKYSNFGKNVDFWKKNPIFGQKYIFGKLRRASYNTYDFLTLL